MDKFAQLFLTVGSAMMAATVAVWAEIELGPGVLRTIFAGGAVIGAIGIIGLFAVAHLETKKGVGPYSIATGRFLTLLRAQHDGSEDILDAVASVMPLRDDNWAALSGNSQSLRDFLVTFLRDASEQDRNLFHDSIRTMKATYETWNTHLLWSFRWGFFQRWLGQYERNHVSVLKLWTYADTAWAEHVGMTQQKDFKSCKRLMKLWIKS